MPSASVSQASPWMSHQHPNTAFLNLTFFLLLSSLRGTTLSLFEVKSKSQHVQHVNCSSSLKILPSLGSLYVLPPPISTSAPLFIISLLNGLKATNWSLASSLSICTSTPFYHPIARRSKIQWNPTTHISTISLALCSFCSYFKHLCMTSDSDPAHLSNCPPPEG